MKKALLVTIIVFVAVFLLWPSYKATYTNTSTCEDIPGADLRDCISTPEVTGHTKQWGGGLDHLNGGYFLDNVEEVDPNPDDTEFQPIRAAIGAFAVALVSGALVLFITKRRR